MSKRIRALLISNNKLIGLNLFNETTSPHIKASLFKIFLRPVELYGLENFSLSSSIKTKMARAETTIIKKLIGISPRAHHTVLLNALNIRGTLKEIDKIKIDMLLKLTKNEITLELLQKLSTGRHQQSMRHRNFLKEIITILGISPNSKLDTIVTLSKKYSKMIKSEETHAANHPNSKTLIIKKILNFDNKIIMKNALNRLLAF